VDRTIAVDVVLVVVVVADFGCDALHAARRTTRAVAMRALSFTRCCTPHPTPRFHSTDNFSKEVVEVYTMRSSRPTMRRAVRTNAVCPGPIDRPLLGDFRATTSDKIVDWNIRAKYW
jgi:NAD(P)-dependent dehydrogenase (short-subunit alcohol dehydrogenase family)